MYAGTSYSLPPLCCCIHSWESKGARHLHSCHAKVCVALVHTAAEDLDSSTVNCDSTSHHTLPNASGDTTAAAHHHHRQHHNCFKRDKRPLSSRTAWNVPSADWSLSKAPGSITILWHLVPHAIAHPVGCALLRRNTMRCIILPSSMQYTIAAASTQPGAAQCALKAGHTMGTLSVAARYATPHPVPPATPTAHNCCTKQYHACAGCSEAAASPAARHQHTAASCWPQASAAQSSHLPSLMRG